MNLFGLSPGELLLILLVAMIVLGPEKLPETAASIGKWIREFRRVTTELTQQFAEDNPFTEIQRALSFTDEPIAPTAPAYTPIVTTPAAESVASQPSAVTLEQPAAPVVSAPRRSDYFDRPTYYAAIDDAWAHGGLSDAGRRLSQNGATTFDAVADEWTHGVAILPPKAIAEETSAVPTEAPVEVAPTAGINVVEPGSIVEVDTGAVDRSFDGDLVVTEAAVSSVDGATPTLVNESDESKVDSVEVARDLNGVAQLNGHYSHDLPVENDRSPEAETVSVAVGIGEESES